MPKVLPGLDDIRCADQSVSECDVIVRYSPSDLLRRATEIRSLPAPINSSGYPRQYAVKIGGVWRLASNYQGGTKKLSKKFYVNVTQAYPDVDAMMRAIAKRLIDGNCPDKLSEPYLSVMAFDAEASPPEIIPHQVIEGISDPSSLSDVGKCPRCRTLTDKSFIGSECPWCSNRRD